MSKRVEQLERVIIRFAGDSGDGMQLTGDQFTSETATLGNDLATFPEYPGRDPRPRRLAPRRLGLPGPVRRPRHPHARGPSRRPRGDEPGRVEDEPRRPAKGGTLIVNPAAFDKRKLEKAGYAANPLEDGSLADYHLHEVALTSMTVEALKGIDGITSREAERWKNFFALGLDVVAVPPPARAARSRSSPEASPSGPSSWRRTRALKAGCAFGETAEMFAVPYEVEPAKLAPGTYRQITGNARSRGVARRREALGSRLFFGAYPITPAIVDPGGAGAHKASACVTFQAEDEIAAVGAALGASFGGCARGHRLGGPGIVLKAEAIGLAVSRSSRW